MERRLVWTVALCLALLLAVTLFCAVCPPNAPAPSQQPTPSPTTAPARTLALLSSRAAPRAEALYGGLEEWAKEENWSFVSYDCQGWAVSQQGQVEDLVRKEHADVVVVESVGTQEELDSWVELLHGSGCQVITLGQAAGGNAQAHVACHIDLDVETLGKAVAEQLIPAFLGQRREVLLVVDAPEDSAAQRALDALEKAGLSVAEYGACWGQSQYAQEYLSGALERHPYVSAVFCLSHAGALGTRAVLGERKDAAILALDCDRELLDDIALGQADAALAVPTGDVLAALTQAIDEVVQGKTPEDITLTPMALTKENVDTIDLGY